MGHNKATGYASRRISYNESAKATAAATESGMIPTRFNGTKNRKPMKASCFI
jgi:hypothetical protein